MSYQKVKTLPDLSLESSKHLEKASKPFEHFSDSRNVADHFKGLPDEDIINALKLTANPFAVLFENFTSDFNIATAIRNANGFNAEAIYYIGYKRLDRRGAVGAYKYSKVNFLETVDELEELKNKYNFVGVDNVPGATDIINYSYPTKPLLVFGEEGAGITPAVQKMCTAMVKIPMYGSVRSFNVGTASGIVMYDFISKMKCT